MAQNYCTYQGTRTARTLSTQSALPKSTIKNEIPYVLQTLKFIYVHQFGERKTVLMC